MITLFVVEQESELLEVFTDLEKAESYANHIALQDEKSVLSDYDLEEEDLNEGESSFMCGYECGEVNVHSVDIPEETDKSYMDYVDYDNTYIEGTNISLSDIIEFYETVHKGEVNIMNPDTSTKDEIDDPDWYKNYNSVIL